MSEDYRAAKLEALRRVTEFIAARVRHRAPSAEDADSFRTGRRGEEYFIRSDDVSTWATETNARHPFWGRWSNSPKVATNWARPERTGWASRAVLEAADDAGDQFLSTYLERIAVSSSIFDLN